MTQKLDLCWLDADGTGEAPFSRLLKRICSSCCSRIMPLGHLHLPEISLKTRYTIPSIPMLMSSAPIFTKHTSISYNIINFPHPKGPKPPRLPKSQVFLSRIRCIQAQPHGLPGIAIPIGAHDALSGLTTHELRGVPERKGIRKTDMSMDWWEKMQEPHGSPPYFMGKSIESHICHQTIYLFEIVFDILYQQKHSIKLLIVGWC